MASQFSLKAILSQNLEQVNKYKEKELRELVKFMNKEVIKRQARLEDFEDETRYYNEYGELKGGSTSPALYRIRTSGGTRESENFQKLRNDFKRAYNFLKDPTSQITKWKNIRKQLKDKFIEYTGITSHTYKWIDEFFNAYNKYIEDPEGAYNSLINSYGSEQTFKEAAQMYQKIASQGYFEFSTENKTLYVDDDIDIESIFSQAMEDLYRFKSSRS